MNRHVHEGMITKQTLYDTSICVHRQDTPKPGGRGGSPTAGVCYYFLGASYETSPGESPHAGCTPSSLTHVHRCIGNHRPTCSLSKSVRLTYLSVYDNSDNTPENTLPVPPHLAYGYAQYEIPHSPHVHVPHLHVLLRS
jgi:hypothetical protein